MMRLIGCILIASCFYANAAAQKSSNPAAWLYYEKTDTGWVVVALRMFHYDSLSNLVEAADFSKEEKEWKERRSTMYQYPHDTLRFEINSEWNSGKRFSSRDKYIRDRAGRDIAVVYEDYDTLSSGWKADVKGEFLKDANGNISEKKYMRYKDGEWKNEDRILFSYDASGQEKEEVFQIWENQGWMTHQKSVHHYNPGGQLDFTEVFHQDKSATGKLDPQPSARHLFRYDSRGNLVEMRIQKFSGGEWQDEFKRESINR